MRLFVGIEFSEEVVDELLKVQNQIKSEAKRGRFVVQSNLHLTLQFLGEVSEERLGPIEQALRKTAQRSREFSLELKNVGSFGSGQSFRVIWVGIDGDKQELVHLQKDLSISLDKLGFPRKNRPYKPHITLGRNVEFNGEASFEEYSESLMKAPFLVNEISLIESTVENGKRIYRSLSSFRLSAKH